MVSLRLHLLTALSICTLTSAVRNAIQRSPNVASKEVWNCNSIVGASPRTSEPHACKCVQSSHVVYCGYKDVAKRKFLASAVQVRQECQGETPYCAGQPERPPVRSILREDPCQEWALFSVTSLTVAAGFFDSFRSLKLSTVATAQPGGLRYKSKVLRSTRSGNPEFHFLVPSNTRDVEVQVLDGSSVALVVHTGSVEALCKRGESVQYATADHASVTVQATENSKLNAKLSELIGRGAVITEAYHPMFDEAETMSQTMDVMSYYKKWAAYRTAGYAAEDVPATAMWEKLEKGCYDKCQLAPISPNSTKVIGYAYAVRAMKQMGPKLQCGNLFRRNEFGANILNEVWWPEKPTHSIGLADNEVDHGLSRKWVDRLVGPAVADRQETIDMISTSAKKLWEANTISLKESLKWTTLILHRLLAFMELSDQEATELLEHKESATVGMMLPTFAGRRMSSSAIEWKKRRLPVYNQSMADHFGEEWTSLTHLQQSKLASGILDALLFAGGISVPAVIRTCFAVLFGTYGKDQTQKQFGKGWHLGEEQLEPFIQEAIRRFPPVGGFPAWDRATNSKVSVDLRGANADRSEEGWGPHARDFWLRDMSEYEQKSISWGDFAIVNGDNAHPGSRACAAKRLSFIMVREFLRAFLKRGGTRCWSPTDPTEVKLGGQGGAAFTVARNKCAAESQHE